MEFKLSHHSLARPDRLRAEALARAITARRFPLPSRTAEADRIRVEHMFTQLAKSSRGALERK